MKLLRLWNYAQDDAASGEMPDEDDDNYESLDMMGPDDVGKDLKDGDPDAPATPEETALAAKAADETTDDTPVVDESADEEIPADENPEPTPSVEFDEALVADAKKYGLDTEDFPNAASLTKAVNALTRKEIEAFRPQQPQPVEAKPPQPEAKQPPAAKEDFNLEFPEDFDPDAKAVIEKMNARYEAELKARDEKINSFEQSMRGVQEQAAIQVFNSWASANKELVEGLDQKQLRDVYDDANALADSWTQRGQTWTPEEVIRRAYYSRFPDRVTKAENANTQKKHEQRKTQITQPPNRRANKATSGKGGDYTQMPRSRARAEAYLDTVLPEFVGASDNGEALDING